MRYVAFPFYLLCTSEISGYSARYASSYTSRPTLYISTATPRTFERPQEAFLLQVFGPVFALLLAHHRI